MTSSPAVNWISIEISVVFNWYDCKLLIFTKHHCELIIPLDHHGLSMPISPLAVNQEDVVSTFLIHVFLVFFFFFCYFREAVLCGTGEGSSGTCLCLILKLYWESSSNHQNFSIANKRIHWHSLEMWTVQSRSFHLSSVHQSLSFEQ